MVAVLAHPGHGAASGNVLPIVLLVVAGVLLVGGLGVLAWRGVKPTAWALLAAGTLAGGFGLLVDGDDDEVDGGGQAAVPIDVSNVNLSVVEPAAGTTVPAGEPITVQVALDGGPLATSPEEDGGHLHLAVDGDLIQMQYADETEVELDPGRHTLTVEYVDNLHVPFDPAIEETVEVVAAAR